MKIASPPTVSIGMPIYNAEASLRTALDALLAQDYSDFELVINDNCSTDSTWEICREYAAHDSRIRLYRNSENIGGIANFNRVFERCAGKYFMWAAHDDYWEPTFLSACVEQLEANPDAVLCYVHFVVRRTANQTEERLPDNREGLESLHVWKRLQTLLILYPFPYHMIYGLLRRNSVLQALPLQSSLGSDGFFLLRMAKTGTFVEVDQPLFIATKEGKRDLKVRAKVFGESDTILTVLKWDFNLFRIPLAITQSTALSLRKRCLLFIAVLRFGYNTTGWPSPRRVFNRYNRFVLSAEQIARYTRWYWRISGKRKKV